MGMVSTSWILAFFFGFLIVIFIWHEETWRKWSWKVMSLMMENIFGKVTQQHADDCWLSPGWWVVFPCRWSQWEGVQRMLMERDHIGFGRVDSGHERRISIMDEWEWFLGKIQRRIKIFLKRNEEDTRAGGWMMVVLRKNTRGGLDSIMLIMRGIVSVTWKKRLTIMQRMESRWTKQQSP